MARVLFLDPYHGPSHSALSSTLRDRSRHDVTLLSLPPRKWKWRMRGAALAFEPQVRSLPEPPDVLVTTDMLNLPEMLALARDRLSSRMPSIVYFHENQLTYPLPARDERDFHFGLCNLHSALAADRVVFNSRFHRVEFAGALPDLIKAMPDHRPDRIVERILGRSEVLGVPLDLPARGAPPGGSRVLWNHRWEEDKDPETFFRVMRRLDRRGIDFRLVVLGESFRERPACFDAAERDLRHRIERWGYEPSRVSYLDEVARCRVVVSTALHEFYGLAVREAIALGCHPLLPRRVVYPEMVEGRSDCLYNTEEELADRLEEILTGPPRPADEALIASMRVHEADAVVAIWDRWFDELTR